MPEITFFEDIEFVVAAEPHSHHVEYRVYNVMGQDYDGHALMERHDGNRCVPEEDINKASVFMHGDVKWDGCSNWYFDEQDTVMLHCCTRESLVAIGEVMARCWDMTADLCPNWWADHKRDRTNAQG